MLSMCKNCKAGREYHKYFLIICSPNFSVLSVIKLMAFELIKLKHWYFLMIGPTLFESLWTAENVDYCSCVWLGWSKKLNEFYMTLLEFSSCLHIMVNSFTPMTETYFSVWWAYETGIKTDIMKRLWCCTSCKKWAPFPVLNHRPV